MAIGRVVMLLAGIETHPNLEISPSVMDFKNTVFYKGPLIYNDEKYQNLVTLGTLMSFKAYRNKAKASLLKSQSQGDTAEWEACNFSLYEICGLRRSARNYLAIA